MTIVFTGVFLIFNTQLPLMYLDSTQSDTSDNQEVLHLASQLIIAAGIFQISDGIQATVIGALRGLQDVKIPTLITFISYWVIGFPISYYYGQAEQMGSFGIWIGLIVGLSTAAVLLFWRFEYVSKRLVSKTTH